MVVLGEEIDMRSYNGFAGGKETRHGFCTCNLVCCFIVTPAAELRIFPFPAQPWTAPGSLSPATSKTSSQTREPTCREYAPDGLNMRSPGFRRIPAFRCRICRSTFRKSETAWKKTRASEPGFRPDCTKEALVRGLGQPALTGNSCRRLCGDNIVAVFCGLS